MKESRIAQPAAQPGDVIAHYRLVERLGRDNDTTIYRAKDLKVGLFKQDSPSDQGT